MRYSSIFAYYTYFAFTYVLADSDDVVFPDRTKGRNLPWQQSQAKPKEISQPTRSSKSIPLDMILKLNSVTDEKQFVDQFIDFDPLQFSAPSTSHGAREIEGKNLKRLSRLTNARSIARDTTDIEPHQIAFAYSLSGASPGRGDGVGTVTSRFGGNDSDGQNDKKNVVMTPKPAGCEPELRTVTLRDTEDPTLYYFPSCTRVDRCGGCCVHDLLSCQPVTVEYKNYSVIIAKYNGGQKFEQRGRKIITVEQHKKCKCDCRIKPKDCTSLQEYRKNDCRCVCTNKEEESKCAKDKTRLWNPSTCSCQCREVQDCSTGLTFDETSCSCAPYPKQFSPDYTRYKIGYPEQ